MTASDSDMTEIEVKLYVPDLAQAAAELETQGAALMVPRVFERNLCYEDPAGSFGERGVVLRLRQDTRVRLTYKESHEVIDDVLKRFEAEVEVSDFDTLDLILRKLGYTQQMIYEKYRTTYMLDGAEIVLDELPYGNFVEIEGPVDKINALVQSLGWTAYPRVTLSYTLLFQRLREHHGLAMRNLTFADFETVSLVDVDLMAAFA